MKKQLLLPLILGAALAAQAQVTAIFDGSLNYDAGGNTAFATAAGAAALTQTVAKTYDLVTPMASTYDDLAPGPDIFGGVYGYAEAIVETGIVPSGVYRGGDIPEKIRYQSPMNTATAANITAGILRTATLFSTAGIGTDFSAITVLGMDITMALAATTGTYEMRWLVVGDSGTTYVSESTIPALTVFILTSVSLTDPASINWAVATPDAQMNLGTLTYNVPGNSIAGITHVGVYINASATGPSARYTFDITKFSAGSPATEPVVPVGVAVAIAGPDVELTFATVAGQSYQLLVSTDNMATWENVIGAGASGIGDGNPLTLTDAGGTPASGAKFYKVETN